MKIAGFVPLSLCDYPGRLASVVFTQGCNFRCPWCHNPQLITTAPANGSSIAQSEILELMCERRRRIDGLVISGGEPTLQRGLMEFVARAKGLQLKVKLDTNGSHPELLRRLLVANLLDFVALDIKAPWHAYQRLVGLPGWDPTPVRESMQMLSSFKVPHLLRTTRVPHLLNAEECAEIERQLPPKSRHLWQEYREREERNKRGVTNGET